MFAFLKNHPFPVKAHFEESLVLTFAVPREEILHLLPPCVVPDTFKDHWAFIAVAMVQTRGLRPAGFPAWSGSDFFLTGYRTFVRYTNATGRCLRGLYILGSETNRRKMEWLGNVFTQYRYQTLPDLELTGRNGNFRVASNRSGLEIVMGLEGRPAQLPEESPFRDWKEARRFAGPMPFTFSWLPDSRQVLIVEGVRSGWQPEPVEVVRHRIPFLRTLGCPGLQLASAFRLTDIPYCWKKGRLETMFSGGSGSGFNASFTRRTSGAASAWKLRSTCFSSCCGPASPASFFGQPGAEPIREWSVLR